MKRLFSVIGLALVVAAIVGLSGARDTLANGPGLDPASVDATIFPGDSVDITKTVTTPTIPPNPDVMFLADTTGSMDPAIANVQANAVAVMNTVLAAQPTAEFGAASYKDFDCDPVPYSLDQAITANTAAVQAGVNSWVAGGGCDTPESQLNALYQLATDPATGWRTGSTRIIVWFGDSSGHDPSNGHTLADAIAALQAADIRVIAIPVTTPGGDGLDSTGQATAITTDTGGTLLPAAAPDQVAAAILEGLSNLPVEVSMATDCTGPISVSFDPASQTVTSGENAVFTETISVASDAPGGTYECDDWALIDGQPMTDAAGNIILEHKTIQVPEGFLTGGGQIDSGKGKDAFSISFGGNVGFLADFSLVGQWETNFHNVSVDSLDKARFHSTAITSLQFFNDGGAGPNPPPANANVALFTATGRLNGEDGWTLDVCLADRGEPGRQNDSIRLALTDPSGTLVYDSRGSTDFSSEDPGGQGGVCDSRHLLDAGNLQIHSGVKGP